MIAGQIEIQMAANIVRLKQGLDEAQGLVDKAAQRMGAAAEFVRGALGGMATGLTAGAFAALVKDAIDAADALDEMSSRIGVGVDQLSRLQLAYQMAGMDSAAMQSSLGKLQKEIAADNDALKQLGIRTRDASGRLRESTDVLYDIADAWAGAEDGTAKTAAAMAIFGKSGAEMNGLLSMGSAGLRDMAEQAEQLGLVLDSETAAAAAHFNDQMDLLLGRATGLQREIAFALLPTLNDINDVMLMLTATTGKLGDKVESTTEKTRELSAVAQAIGVVFEALNTLGRNVSFVRDGIGRDLGGMAAQLHALATMNFAGFRDLHEHMVADAQAARAALDAQDAAIVGSTERMAQAARIAAQFGISQAEAAGEVARLNGRLGQAEKAQLKYTGATNDAAKTQIAAGKKLLADATARLQVLEQEAQQGEKLTDGQKFALDAMEALRDGRVQLTAAEKVALTNLIELIRKQELYAESAKKARTEAEALAEMRRRDNEAAEAHIAAEEERALQSARAAEGAVRAAQLEYQTQGMLHSQIAEVTLQRLLDEQAGLRAGTALYEAKQREIAAQRELIAVLRKSEVRDANAAAARAAAEEWQRTSDQVGQALANALMQGGKDAGEQLKNYFKTLVLRPIIEAAVQPLANAIVQVIAAAMGNGGAGGAAGGTNWVQAASTANSLYSYATGNTAVGRYVTSALYGNAAAYNAAAYGQLLGSGASTAAGSQAAMLAAQTGEFGAAGYAATAEAAAGAGSAGGSSAMGSFGAYAAYAAMIYAAAQYASKLYGEGFTGSKQIGDEWYYKYSDKALNKQVFEAIGLSEKWTEILSGSVRWNHMFGRAAPRVTDQGFRGTIGGGDFSGEAYRDVLEKGGLFRSDKRYTETAGLSAEIDRFLDDASQSVMGQAKKFGEALGLPADELASVTTQVRVTLTDDVEKNKAEIAKALGQYGDALIAGWADELEPLKQYGETVAQTIARVGSAMVDVNHVLEAMGASALEASVAGGQAAMDLQKLFGGMSNLGTAAGQYVSKYFTEAERANMQTDALTKALATVNLQMPATREGFRAVVEAQDLSTEAGRRAFAVLLANADAFDVLASAAEQANEQLTQERLGLEGQLLQLQGNVVELRRRERDALDETNRALYDQVQALTDANRIGQERLGLEGQLLQLQGNVAELRRRERAQLDESNRALYDQVKALEDQERAAEAAAEAAEGWKSLQQNALAGVASAYQNVARAADAERQRVEGEADKALRDAEAEAERNVRELERRAQEIDRLFGGLLDGLADGIRKLSGELAGDDGRGQAIALLRSGLADMQAGRAVDVDRLREAASAASTVDPNRYGSEFEYRREMAVTANLLRDVSGATRGQRTAQLTAIAAQQVAIEKARDDQVAAIELARDRQLHALDQQLLTARQAAQSLVDIDVGVQGVGGAIAQLTAAIAAATRITTGKSEPQDIGKWVRSGDTEVWGAAGGATAARPVGATIEGTLIRGLTSTFTQAEGQAWVNDRLASNDIIGIYARAKAEGIDSAALDAMMGWPAGTSLRGALQAGLAAFESGTGYVPNTGIALVHEGERIIRAQDNETLMEWMGGGNIGADICTRLIAEVRELKASVLAMHQDNNAGQRRIHDASAKSAHVLEAASLGTSALKVRE